MRTYICESCKVEFESKKGCKSRTPKFCSLKCYGESLKLNKKCKLCGNIIENKHSVSMKNRVYCSKDCQSKARKGVPLSDEWKKALSDGRKNSEKCKGENLYNWKGGKETKLIRYRIHNNKRRTLLNKKIDVLFLEKLILIQDNKCFFCECDLTKYKAIEHLTPVSRGGDNDIYNLVYSCKSCNSNKRQQTLEEYAIKNKRLDLLQKWEELYIETL
jgi:hypothetical protein